MKSNHSSRNSKNHIFISSCRASQLSVDNESASHPRNIRPQSSSVSPISTKEAEINYFLKSQRKYEFESQERISLDKYYGASMSSSQEETSQISVLQEEDSSFYEGSRTERKPRLTQKNLDLIRKQVLSSSFVEEKEPRSNLSPLIRHYFAESTTPKNKVRENLVEKIEKRLTHRTQKQQQALTERKQEKERKARMRNQLISYQKVHSNLLSTPRRDYSLDQKEGRTPSPKRKLKLILQNGKHFYAPIQTQELESSWNQRYNYVYGERAGVRQSEYVVGKKNNEMLKDCTFKPQVTKKAKKHKHQKNRLNFSHIITRQQLVQSDEEDKNSMERTVVLLEDPIMQEVYRKKAELEEKRSRVSQKVKETIKLVDYQKRGYLTLPLLHLMLQEMGLLNGFSDFIQNSSEELRSLIDPNDEELSINMKDIERIYIEKKGIEEQFIKKWEQEVKLINQIAFKINPDNTNKLRREAVFAFFNLLLNRGEKTKEEIAKRIKEHFEKRVFSASDQESPRAGKGSLEWSYERIVEQFYELCDMSFWQRLKERVKDPVEKRQENEYETMSKLIRKRTLVELIVKKFKDLNLQEQIIKKSNPSLEMSVSTLQGAESKGSHLTNPVVEKKMNTILLKLKRQIINEKIAETVSQNQDLVQQTEQDAHSQRIQNSLEDVLEVLRRMHIQTQTDREFLKGKEDSNDQKEKCNTQRV